MLSCSPAQAARSSEAAPDGSRSCERADPPAEREDLLSGEPESRPHRVQEPRRPMAAGRGRSVRGVNETRPRRASGREVGSERPDDPRDDWLGDVSDDDWSAGPTETVSRPRPSVPDDGFADEPVSSRPARTSGANRSAVARRRLIAGALLVGLIGLAGVVAVVLLRGDDSSTTPVSQPVASPTTTQTTPSPRRRRRRRPSRPRRLPRRRRRPSRRRARRPASRSPRERSSSVTPRATPP